MGNKPRRDLVSTDDRMIPPSAQRDISDIAIAPGLATYNIAMSDEIGHFKSRVHGRHPG